MLLNIIKQRSFKWCGINRVFEKIKHKKNHKPPTKKKKSAATAAGTIEGVVLPAPLKCKTRPRIFAQRDAGHAVNITPYVSIQWRSAADSQSKAAAAQARFAAYRVDSFPVWPFPLRACFPPLCFSLSHSPLGSPPIGKLQDSELLLCFGYN